MTKLQTLSKIYEVFAEAWLPDVGDELDTDPIASFFGPADFDLDDYSRVQRDFGWDDTH
jgi:hypothetical protein